MSAPQYDLSIVIPALHEAENLKALLPELTAAAERVGIHVEILVVDGGSGDNSREITESNGGVFLERPGSGYGAALLEGVRSAQAEYVLTMDADLSHPADTIDSLWRVRGGADIVIASRYVEGGSARQPIVRLWLSRILNGVFRRAYALSVRDMTSGYRLYRRELFDGMSFEFDNFVMLLEILLKASAQGRTIREIPFDYQPRASGSSKARILRFGLDYLRLLIRRPSADS